jgi:hypothetical protein
MMTKPSRKKWDLDKLITETVCDNSETDITDDETDW